MTRYTVVWHQAAQDELAQIWLDESDRDAVARSSNLIDTNLRTDPETQGTPIIAALRELIVPPLHIIFGVSEPDRLVKVVSVERCPK